jgi:hypothetical protein
LPFLLETALLLLLTGAVLDDGRISTRLAVAAMAFPILPLVLWAIRRTAL